MSDQHEPPTRRATDTVDFATKINKAAEGADSVRKLVQPVWGVLVCIFLFVWNIYDLRVNGSENFRQYQLERRVQDEQTLKLLTELSTSVRLVNQKMEAEKERDERQDREIERIRDGKR